MLPQERWEVWDKYIGEDEAYGPCAACERRIRFRDMTVGHNTALSKEGLDTIANMRPLCKSCNEAMGTDSINEYRQRLHGPATISMQDKLIKETLEAWEVVRRETAAVRKQFIATGPVAPDGKFPMPPRVLDTQGMEELKAAEEKEKAAWEAHQDAIDGLRRSLRST